MSKPQALACLAASGRQPSVRVVRSISFHDNSAYLDSNGKHEEGSTKRKAARLEDVKWDSASVMS